MRIYKHKDERVNSCSYCRDPKHRATECATAAYDFQEWSNHRVPIKSPTAKGWMRYDYTQWYKQAYRVREMVVRKEARANRKKAGTATRRAPSKCGFCGEQGHNRRNCGDLASYKQSFYTANQNWRRAVHQKLVKEMGISVGAAIKVDVTRRHWNNQNAPPEYRIGLVTKVSWDSGSFLTPDTNISADYRDCVDITLLIDGEERTLAFTDALKDNFGRTVLPAPRWWGSYNIAKFTEVVGPSKTPLDEKWVTEGMKNEFDFLLKKRSLAQLDDYRIIGQHDKWK